MTDADSAAALRNEAMSAVLKQVIRTAETADPHNTKRFALAYRLLAGGSQPGGSIVEPPK